jgi:chemotaxis signal transduction protein
VNTLKVMTFSIGSTLLAIESHLIEEIFVLSNITRIPVAPPFMNWIAPWQGNVIPIVDLSPFVSEKLKGIVTSKIGMAVKSGGKDLVYGLVVDEIGTTQPLPVVAVPPKELPYFAKSRVLLGENLLWVVSSSKIEKMVIGHIGKLS